MTSETRPRQRRAVTIPAAKLVTPLIPQLIQKPSCFSLVPKSLVFSIFNSTSFPLLRLFNLFLGGVATYGSTSQSRSGYISDVAWYARAFWNIKPLPLGLRPRGRVLYNFHNALRTMQYLLHMTEWNPSNPFDLGVWENLGVPPPLHGTYPEGYSLPKLPIPPTLDLCWENLCTVPSSLPGTPREGYSFPKLPTPLL